MFHLDLWNKYHVTLQLLQKIYKTMIVLKITFNTFLKIVFQKLKLG